MKETIEHIQNRLRQALGIPIGEDLDIVRASRDAEEKAEESGDDIQLEIPNDSSSSNEDQMIADDEKDLSKNNEFARKKSSNITSSNHVSTLREPSMSISE